MRLRDPVIYRKAEGVFSLLIHSITSLIKVKYQLTVKGDGPYIPVLTTFAETVISPAAVREKLW